MATILHSIHGKRLGFDKNYALTQGETTAGLAFPQIKIGPNNSEVLVDIQGLTSVTVATTNATITARGLQTASSSSNVFTLGDPPTAGAFCTLFATSSSTVVRQFNLNTATLTVGTGVGGGSGTVTAGSTYNTISFTGQGNCVELQAVSTSVWGVIGWGGFSTGATPFSTH